MSKAERVAMTSPDLIADQIERLRAIFRIWRSRRSRVSGDHSKTSGRRMGSSPRTDCGLGPA
jgi:hypothetical protein